MANLALANKHAKYLIKVATKQVPVEMDKVQLHLNSLFVSPTKIPGFPEWAYKEDKEWCEEICRALCHQLNIECVWHHKSKFYTRFIAPTKLYRNYLNRALSKLN